MTDPTPARPAIRVLGATPLHPVLLAVQPALALWAANVGEVLPRDAWPALWQPTLFTLVVWAAASRALRSGMSGALVASVVAFVSLNGGKLAGGQPGILALMVALALVAGAAVAIARAARPTVGGLTAVANVLGLTLLAMALPAVMSSLWSGAALADPGRGGNQDGTAGRDIWYIIPDRYPRADTLADVFDHDNSAFLSGLEERGFQVADASLANYPKTAHSLAATWNFEPVDVLIPDPPADGGNWQPLYALLRDHRLGRILTEAGYEYLHLGTWWSPTASAASADRVLRVDRASEFVSVWRSQTLLPALVGDGADGDLSLRERNRRYTSYQLDMLDRVARDRGPRPRFVLAHVTLPHEPYVFDVDGSLVTREQASSRTREDNIVRQLVYLNRRLEALIDTLLSGPPETWPVIVIQSDEGPHPRERTGPSFDWTTASDAALKEKLATISAILLPESDVVLPEDLTGVNTWRLVLDATIGTSFGAIDDPVEVFPGEERLYDLVDVRPRVE